jgi:hypothetical protein
MNEVEGWDKPTRRHISCSVPSILIPIKGGYEMKVIRLPHVSGTAFLIFVIALAIMTAFANPARATNGPTYGSVTINELGPFTLIVNSDPYVMFNAEVNLPPGVGVAQFLIANYHAMGAEVVGSGAGVEGLWGTIPEGWGGTGAFFMESFEQRQNVWVGWGGHLEAILDYVPASWYEGGYLHAWQFYADDRVGGAPLTTGTWGGFMGYLDLQSVGSPVAIVLTDGRTFFGETGQQISIGVPEPSTLPLILSGIAGLLFLRRRMK